MSNNVTLRVGERYYNRHRHIVHIVTKLDHENSPKFFGEHSQYPFVGYDESNHEWHSFDASGHTYGYEERDEDLIAEFEPSPVLPEIDISAITVGDIVAEMHGHETNRGVVKGWTVASRFEIPEHMFKAMYAAMQLERTHYFPAASGKMAYVISIKENEADFEEVESVMVIYIYDYSYYTATLTHPK